MDRRRFLKTLGSAAAAAGFARTAPDGARALAAEPPPAGAERLRVGCQRWGSDPKRLGFLLRCGVRDICLSPAQAGPDGVWTADSCRARRAAVEQAGLRAISMYWGVPLEVLNPEKRDAAIDRCRRQIAAAGQGGIPCLAYTLNVRVWRARTGHVEGRGGGRYSEWVLEKTERQKGKRDVGPLSADEHWRRIEYFLQRVVPAAEEAKVRLACHPNDPPMPDQNPWHIDQVLDSVQGLKRFVSTCDSPWHGLTFCQGCIWEMLPEQEKPEGLYEAIHWFGRRGKIFQAHFRNLRGGARRFVETYHDDGEIDMVRAVLAFREAGYRGVLMPDHVPGHDEDPEGLQHFAWAYGYIKGLVEAVEKTA